MLLFGDTSFGQDCSLILDRTERTLYVAARADAQTFLTQQWPKAEPVTLTQEEWTVMAERVRKSAQRNRGDIDMEEIKRDIEEINRRIQEQHALVEALQECRSAQGVSMAEAHEQTLAHLRLVAGVPGYCPDSDLGSCGPVSLPHRRSLILARC
jgi:hypothetical protein